jgi:hypothetical protein
MGEVIFLASKNLGGAKNPASSPFVSQEQAGIVFQVVFQAAPHDKSRKIRAQLLNAQTCNISCKVLCVSANVSDAS